MSAALMTLFAMSIVGALGMAVYGLRVLLGRWENPRRPRVLLSVQPTAPMNQLQSQPQPAPPARPQVWVHPTTGVPTPMVPLVGVVAVAVLRSNESIDSPRDEIDAMPARDSAPGLHRLRLGGVMRDRPAAVGHVPALVEVREDVNVLCA
jgi:hypothetical protein